MNRKLRLIDSDPWLEPSSQDIIDRYERFRKRVDEIQRDFGSLMQFAEGYKYYGVNYDSRRKGWTYREWAPQARALYLVGDFNNWEPFDHPMVRNDYGTWEIFLEESRYRSSFVHGSKIKVLVDSEKGLHYRIPAYITRAVQDDDTKNFTGQLWFPGRFNWAGDSFNAETLGELYISKTCSPA